MDHKREIRDHLSGGSQTWDERNGRRGRGRTIQGEASFHTYETEGEIRDGALEDEADEMAKDEHDQTTAQWNSPSNDKGRRCLL